MQIKDLAARKPVYLKGGATDPSKGLDCSGSLDLARKWAGIAGPKRTTAFRMSQGLDGWTSNIVPFATMTQDCDLSFWTWKKSPLRINGHVGAFLRGEDAPLQGLDGLSIAHAGSKGFAIVPFWGVFVRDLSLIRRLNIGD